MCVDHPINVQDKPMKKRSVFLLLSMLCAAQASALEFYKEGAICDRKSGFCADHMGVSLGITRLYLGEVAERNLMAEINKVGIQSFDASTFTMHGDLTCDVKVKTCWTNRYYKKVDAKATQILFGQ
jgi:hypothetical protein